MTRNAGEARALLREETLKSTDPDARAWAAAQIEAEETDEALFRAARERRGR